MKLKFTVKLNPVTKKNSSQIIRVKGVRKIIPSKQYTQYENDAGYFLRYHGNPIESPCEIKCLFYMKSRRKVDLTNLLEAIDDVLVKYNVLADDNSTIITSHDGSRVYYSKENPRTEIYIRTIEEEIKP